MQISNKIKERSTMYIKYFTIHYSRNVKYDINNSVMYQRSGRAISPLDSIGGIYKNIANIHIKHTHDYHSGLHYQLFSHGIRIRIWNTASNENDLLDSGKVSVHNIRKMNAFVSRIHSIAA
jgi:hypothetical protein